MRLSDAAAIVTGGSSGIGFAAALCGAAFVIRTAPCAGPEGRDRL